MHAWIEVADMVNNPAAAESIKIVHDRLIKVAGGNQSQDNNPTSVVEQSNKSTDELEDENKDGGNNDEQ